MARLAVVLLLTLIANAGLASSNGDIIVRGRITDKSGQPAAGATVRLALMGEDGNFERWVGSATKVGGKGDYVFRVKLEAGRQYKVEASLEKNKITSSAFQVSKTETITKNLTLPLTSEGEKSTEKRTGLTKESKPEQVSEKTAEPTKTFPSSGESKEIQDSLTPLLLELQGTRQSISRLAEQLKWSVIIIAVTLVFSVGILGYVVSRELRHSFAGTTKAMLAQVPRINVGSVPQNDTRLAEQLNRNLNSLINKVTSEGEHRAESLRLLEEINGSLRAIKDHLALLVKLSQAIAEFKHERKESREEMAGQGDFKSQADESYQLLLAGQKPRIGSIYLNLELRDLGNELSGPRYLLRETKNSWAAFIGFRLEGSAHGWLFPNPAVEYVASMAMVFKDLTNENSAVTKGQIAARKILLTNSGLWELTDFTQ